ncbi:hypothetical protein KDW_22490 [Dictyobacter vulcani]|uniref:CopC domain-containing protein n=1 Tax=Dictyobacter vulcani TaxID=2607529 RepID=A0A5J4KNT9_9CHLR|nr:copper resistance CopC family protein [Dictyobacter vulcani]GER88087.1 hypothetical protein KDW_22490 [Dictyobacter vulcani]
MLISTQFLATLLKKLSIALCIIWLGIFFIVHPVLALGFHAQYDHSDPVASAHLQQGKPPAAVRVWFSAPIDPRASRLAVYNIRRQRVDLNDSRLAADSTSLRISLRKGLPDGTYTVVFHNVSQTNGYAATDSFFFVVGTDMPPDPDAFITQHTHDTDHNFNPWSIGLRWLNYLGMAGLIGGLLFLLLVWRPVMVQLVGRLDPNSDRYGSSCASIPPGLCWDHWW